MQMYFNVRVRRSAGIQRLTVEDRSGRFFNAVRTMSDQEILLAGSRRTRRSREQALSDPLLTVAMLWLDQMHRERLERLLRGKGSYSALAGVIFDA